LVAEGTNNQPNEKVCTRADAVGNIADIITGLGLVGQAGGYLFAFSQAGEGNLPGVLGGFIFARRAGYLTVGGGALSIAAAAYASLNGQQGFAAAEIVNKAIAAKLAPEGAVRDAIEFALSKVDQTKIANALGCHL